METLKLFVLFVLCIALICLKNNPDAALGDDCTSGSSVCDTTINGICNGTNCVCAETHYDSGGTCTLKKGYGADCTESNECGVPSGGDNQCVAVSGGSKCLCTERKYWAESQCQDVSTIVPVLTLSNPTLSTIDASWTALAAAGYNSVYKLTWTTSGITVGSKDNIAGGPFTIQGLTPETEYTVTIERRITENTYSRMQSVSGENKKETTKKTEGGSCSREEECGFLYSACTNSYCRCVTGRYWTSSQCDNQKGYAANCSQSNECAVLEGGNNQCVAVSGGSKCLCTEGNYWDGSQCKDVSSLVPVLTLSNPTSSTIDASWTTPPAAKYNSVYQLTWMAGGTTASSQDMVNGNTFTKKGLTPGTEYTVSIVRLITEKTHLRMQSVSGVNKKETTKKAYGAVCTGSNECGVPAGGSDQCVAVSVESKCLCTQGKYWTGSQCQDLTELVPVLTLSNPTLSTIDASWTSPAADQYNSVYKLTWATGGTAVGSEDIVTGDHFQIQGLTPGTEYTVSIQRLITEKTHSRMQSVSGGNKKETTKKGYGAACSRSNECGVLAGGNNQCVTVSGASKCLCTEGNYWVGSECQDSSFLVPVLMLSNRTLSTIDASWTTPPADQYNSVYKLTWRAVGTTASSEDMVNGNTFTKQGLTPGTEYTVAIQRLITEKTFSRMQSVSGVNKNETTIPATTKGLKTATTLMAPNITIAFHKAEGLVGYYTIILVRGEPNSYNETITVNGVDESPTASFQNVKAGLHYNLTIITYSYSVSSAPFHEQLRVKVQASEAVVGFAPANITSRSASVSWRRPGDTKGDLYLYSLEIWNASTCVQQMLVCTDCNGNTSAAFNSDCRSIITTNITNNKLNDPTYLLEFTLPLFPDTAYTVYVAAYNELGKGNVADTILQTLTEAPGVPRDFLNVSKTSNSIHLMWTPPMPRPGVTEYNITVYEWQEDVKQYLPLEVIQQLGYYNTSRNITGLSSYWKYRFQNIAKTAKGLSASVNITEVTTNESAPTKVVNLQSRKIAGVFNQIGLSWSCPKQKDGRNGVILKSTLRYSSNTPNADVNPLIDTLPLPNKDCTWNVTVEVTAEFNYTFEVFISNSIDGESSVIHEYMEAGPAALSSESTPKEKQITLSSGQTTIPLAVCPACILNPRNGRVISSGVIVCTTHCNKNRRKRELKTKEDLAKLLTWKQAKAQGFKTEYKASPDNWLANVKGERVTVYKVGNDTSCDEKSLDTYCNGPLTEGTTYAIRVFACTLAGCDESEEIQIETIKPPSNVALILGCIAGGVVAAALVVVLVFVFRYMRRRPTTIKRKLDEASDEEELIIRKRPIRIKDFEKRVETMHKDSNLLFSEEFEDISTLSPKHMCIASETGGNKLKNRYVNILPFDHTRVKLRHAEEDDEETDYINANYIPGYSSPREYIATQGPMTGTVNDFWRMIWEQNVPIIVMLSDLMENGKPKVDRYYPENMDPVQYGDIVLEMTNFSPLNKYVIRIFKLKVGDEVRQVRHYFLPGWKDFGANLNSDDVIDFVKDVRMEIKPNKLGPICVHCSAGVGRTGTYISLDVFQQHINEENMEKELDIFDFVMTMRQNRSYMVQTEKQYIFIHDTIKEMIIKKKKEIAERDNIYENSTNDGIYINQAFETDPQDIYMNVDNDTTKPTTVL